MKTFGFFFGGLVLAIVTCLSASLAAVTVTSQNGAQAERIPIYFPSGEIRLTAGAETVLDETAREAQEAHAVRIVVIGYEGGAASEAERASTASARASIIQQALVKRGIDPRLLYVMAAAAPPQAGFPTPAFITDRRAEVIIEHGKPGF